MIMAFDVKLIFGSLSEKKLTEPNTHTLNVPLDLALTFVILFIA